MTAPPPIPPHDQGLEREALGGAFHSVEIAVAVAAWDPALFFIDRHRDVQRALAALVPALNGTPPSIALVGDALRAAGRTLDTVLLARMVDEGTLVVDLSRYVDRLRALAAERERFSAAVMAQQALAEGTASGEATWHAIAARLERARTLQAISVEPTLERAGLDLAVTWPDGARFALAAIRDGRDGVRGELTVTLRGRRLSWGAVALSNVSARDALRKKLDGLAPGLPWSAYLEDMAFRLTEAVRQDEPLVALTGVVMSPTRELLPRVLYEGEPTLLYADGDTGKSLTAVAISVAVHSHTALPFGLKPARAVPVAYLDWETSRDTLETRVALLAAGLGIDPPPILYKRMRRPLVDVAAPLAAEFARHAVGLVVVDSKMFAVAGGDGAAFHEPITAFYNALRLFAPAASLVLNHITNDAAKNGGPARPFGGAFAFNGPRLIWEARRDPDVDDATAIVFTCKKANNLPRKPEPFGLRFQPGDGAVYPFGLEEAAPRTVAGVSLSHRIRLALRPGALTAPELAADLEAEEDSVSRTLRRLADKGVVTKLDGKPARWGLLAR